MKCKYMFKFPLKNLAHKELIKIMHLKRPQIVAISSKPQFVDMFVWDIWCIE